MPFGVRINQKADAAFSSEEESPSDRIKGIQMGKGLAVKKILLWKMKVSPEQPGLCPRPTNLPLPLTNLGPRQTRLSRSDQAFVCALQGFGNGELTFLRRKQAFVLRRQCFLCAGSKLWSP